MVSPELRDQVLTVLQEIPSFVIVLEGENAKHQQAARQGDYSNLTEEFREALTALDALVDEGVISKPFVPVEEPGPWLLYGRA